MSNHRPTIFEQIGVKVDELGTPERTLTIPELIRLADLEAGLFPWGCDACEHLINDSDTFTPWYRCSDRFSRSNLKTFPFKHAPRNCFRLDFWNSAYAYEATDSEGESRDDVLKAWHNTDRFGRWLGADREDMQWADDGGCELSTKGSAE